MDLFFYWTIFRIVSAWVIRLALPPIIVLRKENPAACLAWVAVVFLEPWLGLAAYLLFGENRLGRRRVAARRVGRTQLASAERPAREAQYLVTPGQPEQPRLLVHLPEHPGGLPVVSGNGIVFLSNPEAAIDELVAAIQQARHHVHLLFYIFADDTVGRQVGAALVQARDRGVACRVLADAVGSRRMFRGLGRELAEQGVQVLPALPVNLVRRPLARLDLRNHRKLAVIDGRVALTGSQNVVEFDYGNRRAGNFVDLMARVTGPAVRYLQEVFLEDWFHESGELLEGEQYFPALRADGTVAVQVVPTGPDLPTEQFQDVIVKAIFLAQRQVTITSPYFVPDEPMLMALRLAARRGVQVELVIPHRSNHPLVDAAGQFYCQQIMRQGAEVYLYEPGMLHSKTLTVDNQLAMFGSANYDIRSFDLNFELNLLLHGQQAVSEMRALQEGYRRSATAAVLGHWPSPHLKTQLKINLAKLASPVL